MFCGLQTKQRGYVHCQKKAIGEIMPPYISVSHFSESLESSLVQISVLQGAPPIYLFCLTNHGALPATNALLSCLLHSFSATEASLFRASCVPGIQVVCLSGLALASASLFCQ